MVLDQLSLDQRTSRTIWKSFLVMLRIYPYLDDCASLTLIPKQLNQQEYNQGPSTLKFNCVDTNIPVIMAHVYELILM